jgi:hypothetical protein
VARFNGGHLLYFIPINILIMATIEFPKLSEKVLQIIEFVLLGVKAKKTETFLLDQDKVRPNKDNPRNIKSTKFQSLKKSIKDAPWMLLQRPIQIDEEGIILGGNMRFRAAISAGMKEIPVEIIIGRTEEEKKEFIIKDNIGFGEWDWDILANNYDHQTLIDYGMDMPMMEEKEPTAIDGDEPFSEWIDEENNYVVLFFDNRINWLQAQTHFSLATVYSKRSNGKKWNKGVGRVIDGAKYLKALKDEL